jgi:catechol 2,3-dioxygenase-like lactoylglutathione lyase family enzyme
MHVRLRWSHAVVYVRDLDEMVDFYTHVLGFEVTDRGPIGPEGSPELVFLSQVETDHHQLALLPVRSGDEPPNTVNHFAFRTDSLADVRAAAERLREDGRAEQIDPVTHGNAWSIYFRDPEGNGVEIFCDTPWHVRQPQARPWDPSLSDAELERWTRAEFEKEPEFGPIDAFYAARAEHLRRR